MLFDVRVLAFDPSAPDPVLALMRVFKVERPLAEELVTGLPRVVKRGVPLETAQRFSHVLGSLGAETEVVTAGGRARAASGADMSAMEPTPSSAYSTQRYTLPQPNRVAIDTALARAPENANGTRQSGVLGAIQLTKVARASSPGHQPITELQPEPRVSHVQGRVLRETLPDPDLQADMMFRETVEARARIAKTPSSHPGSYSHSNRPAASSQRPAASSARPGAHASHSGRPAAASPQTHGAALRHSLPGSDPARRVRARAALAGLTTAVVRGASLAQRKAQLRARGPLVLTAWVLSIVMLACLSLITLGMLPVVLLGMLAFDLCKRWSLRRSIESSAVLAGSAQLPELHACVRDLAERLELPRPRLYVSGGASGVTSVVLGDEVTLLVSAETLAAHVDNEQCHALAFVIAHELSAVALGQRRRLRGFLAWLWPQVRKLDVLAADTLAVELMADRNLAHAALLTLLMGPRVAQLLDAADLDRQAALHATESRFYAPALAGQAEFLLARLYRLRRA